MDHQHDPRDVQIPDHQRDGKTLPQQIEGDHAYRDDPPEHDPNPESGYDDTIWVVSEHFSDRDHNEQNPVAAYRSEEEAREAAEEIRSDPFVHATVTCVGLHH